MKISDFDALACALLLLPVLGCDGEQELEDEYLDEEYVISPDEAEAQIEAADALVLDAPVSAAANYYEPIGTLDRADCSKIAGWVKDGDTTAPTWASIRTAPWPGGSEVATPFANLYRDGLPFADKNHGFSIDTPAWLKDGVTRTIYVHGINVDVNGDWDVGANSPLLNGSGKQICCGAGCYEPPNPSEPPLPE